MTMTDPQESLTGQVAMVTGGGAGLGLATAEHLVAKGSRLVLVDLTTGVYEVAARLENRYGQTVKAIVADVSDEIQMGSVFGTIREELGRLDILVNNAGIMTREMVPLTQVAMADFERMLNVHLKGAFNCAQLAIPMMKPRRYGRIVNITSVLGSLGLPNRSAYAVAKTGILGLTRSIAVENGRDGITANAVLPGWILTDRLRARLAEGKLEYDNYANRTPVGHWGDPEDVARLIRFLALPGSEFITGTVIPVDGGYCMRGDSGDDTGQEESSRSSGVA